MPKILLIDDDIQSLESTRKILQLAGHEVLTAEDGQQGMELIAGQGFDLVITDVRMPRLSGLEFLKGLSAFYKTVPVILMTAFGRVDEAVWAMKLGAADFLTKPFKRQDLLLSVDNALKRSGPSLSGLASPAAQPQLFDAMTGSSEAMTSLRLQMLQVARSSASVLIYGESGTGKELVAKLIHSQSDRSKRNLVALNCAALPEQLIESELFGFEKGAFTGAMSAKEGLFEAAHLSTLLLDEIGDMPLPLQGKLLRVLQEQEVRRVGAVHARKVDVRVIAATHKDLRELVKRGLFREDLLYRLEVIKLSVPALRERMQDVPELSREFLKRACEKNKRSIEVIDPETLSILMQHSWPGNVRELANVMERAVVFCSGTELLPEHLPSHLVQKVSMAVPTPEKSGDVLQIPIGTPLREVEEMMILKTLEATAGNKNETAKLLGINSRTIYRKLDKLEAEEEASQKDPSQ